MRILLLSGFLFWAFYSISKGRRIWPLLLAATGIVLARYYDAVHGWLGVLGADSFSEAQNFDLHEALFFLKSIPSVFAPAKTRKWLETIGIGLASVGLLSFMFWWFSRRFAPANAGKWFGRSLALMALFCIGIAVGNEADRAMSRFQSNSAIYEKSRRQFAGNDALIGLHAAGRPDMRIVVYIGESTSLMNWGMYGYAMDTTPGLQAFARENTGFLRFDNVVPTHTHTSPSLLEALSFGMPDVDPYQQIQDRARASLVGVLKRLDVPTVLLSTQGATGTWNLASSIIFSQVDHKQYANPESSLLGNKMAHVRDYDDEFFADALDKVNTWVPQGPVVAFMHSYAGHGDYADSTPAWAQREIDPLFEQAGRESLFGSRLKEPGARLLQDYDDTMRYVDFILARMLDQIKNESRPTVFVYFPDHGESSITGLEHDSSRLQHEMLRIPFLMYFNAEARSQAPELFERFRQASALDRPATLAQVPATIMTLLGVRAEGTQHDYAGVGLDPEPALVPVVVRQLGDGVTYVRSHNAVQGMGLVQASSTIHAPERVQLSYSQQSGAKTALDAKIRDATDPATAIWLYTRQTAAGARRPGICYSQADTWGKMNRGALVADCISVRLKEVPDWPLHAATRVAAARSKTLWLDGTDMPVEQACRLAAALYPYTDSDSAPASSAYAYADSGDGVVADDTISVKNAQPASLSVHSVSGAVIVLELSPDAAETMPQACRDVQSQGATLYLRVPDTVTLSTDVSESTWVQTQAMQSWPANYSFTAPPAPGVLQQLLSTPGARWALGNVRADELPLQPGGNTPAPAMLLIDTSWDINSR